jgi:ketosteroid isomerase-like protein
MSVTSRVRRAALVAGMALGGSLTGSCTAAAPPALTTAERSAIADTLRTLIVDAYDLSRPGDAVARLMSLYPSSGTVVSASGGQVSTSRDSIEIGLRTFWDNVGKNMREPKWTWGAMHVEVLARDAAVVTTTYRVPHLTPRGEAHVFAGAWTAVFQRRDGRWVIVQEHLSDVPAAAAMAPGS